MTDHPDFLSPAWIAALDARLAAQETGSSPTALTVQYIVRDGPGDDAAKVSYHLRLGPDRDSATLGVAHDADVTFRLDRDTAAAIQAGELSSEEAFLTGRLDLEGDAASLIEAHRARND